MTTQHARPPRRYALRHSGWRSSPSPMGGFAIGTTEFVAMGLLPQIADGVDVSIPSPAT